MISLPEPPPASRTQVIAVDAMGGDYTPSEAVAGALLAVEQANVEVVLVGDQKAVEAELAKHGAVGNPKIRVARSEGVIKEGESPIRAMRQKPKASVLVAADYVRTGKADAFLSMGNTGATFASAQLAFGTLEHVDRAVITGRLYTWLDDPPVAIADVGATVDARPEHMLTCAVLATVLGTVGTSIFPGVENPTVALLNVGTESGKGNQQIKKTHALFKKSSLNYIGFIEPEGVFTRAADVVICDGFIGNIFIKTSDTILKHMRDLVAPQLGADHEIVRQLNHFCSPAVDFGATPLLGLNGVAMVGHGSSNAQSFHNAIRLTCRLLASDLVETQKKALAALNAGGGA